MTDADDETPEEPADAPSPPTAYGWPVTEVRGQQVIHPDRQSWAATAQELLDDGWNVCVDVTAVDYSEYTSDRDLPDEVTPERFEVVASFLSMERRVRMRARVQVPGDDPTVDSLYSIYPGIDYQEREVYDLMGIVFEGHPDLSRILMPETWEGHPLRKDFAVGTIPVQFKATGES